MASARFNGYAKWLGLAIALAGGLGAFYTTREKVSTLEKQAEAHVTRDYVDARFEAILRELQALREDLRTQRRVR